MRNHTKAIVSLFGGDVRPDYCEDFLKWEGAYYLSLKHQPTKEDLLAALPTTSDRDSWRLRLLTDGGDDLFDIRKGDILDEAYVPSALEPYINDEVRLIYTIEKSKEDGVLSLYDLQLFLQYVGDIAVTGLYNALYDILQEKLILEIWGDEIERFRTSSLAVIKRGDDIPNLYVNIEKRKRTEICGRYCQWTAMLPSLLPEDLHIVEGNVNGALAKYIRQACLLLSACYVADLSGVEKNQWRIRISGFKTLASESNSVKVKALAFDEKSAEQWFDIYDWCYTGGYTSDRLVIARNIISLNCPDYEHLKLNASTLGAIKSNFKIFEQDNVRQYIKVRNDVSKDLLDLQDRINGIVEGFTGDFRKSVVGLGTFFLTAVVVRVLAGGHWTGAFSNEIVTLSYLFIALSAVVLVYSRLSLDKKEKLFSKHYGQLRERYKPLLSKEEADKIFEDCNPNILGTHNNYIKWQKNRYTWIWALTLVAFAVFLLLVWCYNLYETTNVCKIIKCIFACCTKNI